MATWRVKCKKCKMYLGRWPYNMERAARKVAREHRRRWHGEV